MKKYYYYDVNGYCQAKLNDFVMLISEHPLPGFSWKHKGCSHKGKNIPINVPLSKKIRVAFGDPRVFDCSVLSFSECITRSKIVRNHITAVANIFGDTPITLNYKGGKIWTAQNYLCLLKDLKK